MHLAAWYSSGTALTKVSLEASSAHVEKQRYHLLSDTGPRAPVKNQEEENLHLLTRDKDI